MRLFRRLSYTAVGLLSAGGCLLLLIALVYFFEVW